MYVGLAARLDRGGLRRLRLIDKLVQEETVDILFDALVQIKRSYLLIFYRGLLGVLLNGTLTAADRKLIPCHLLLLKVLLLL